jgi:hypothetical protein
MPQRTRAHGRRHSLDNTHHTANQSGIKKRSTQPRAERDGDLIMDNASVIRGGRGRGRGPQRNNLNHQSIAKAFTENTPDCETFQSRTPGCNFSPEQQNNRPSQYDEIVVRGWKQSAAASNSDQGISQLTAFINRKAGRGDNISIIEEV